MSKAPSDAPIQPYGSRDLAGKYRWTRNEAAAQVPEHVVERDLAAIEKHGFVIIQGLLDDRELEDIRAAATPLLNEAGRNDFEGLKTQRVYAVLAKTRALDRLVDHPRVLALLDRLFLPNYLLSQLQIINILSGEKAQTLHTDDAFYPVPRPRPPLGAATVWAIDDFTEDNGATSIVPGSHHWESDQHPSEHDAIPAVMPAGSVVFYPGTFWHGGGANMTERERLAVTCQYCEPWVRTQENFFLGTPLEVVAAVSEDIRRLLGFSIHPPFVGMVNGMHPKRLLEEFDSQ